MKLKVTQIETIGTEYEVEASSEEEAVNLLSETEPVKSKSISCTYDFEVIE